ncbi:bacterial type II secretion system protein [Thioploca ingrica]|uniref:Bacterial type II secretion system protein n=1 Tax=Thioploca ingrica TaxID=40754 RepID=A0A090BV75_9GAMM|nr:bacterial type II secretion system protein [Thioploca ingrica]
MPQQFFYKAMDSHGRIVQGQISANNINDLEVRLDRMGLDLIHCRTQKLRHLRLGRVTRQELITFCFHMENLTRSGVPLLEGLGDLRDTLPQSRFREIISSLIENIQGGSHLSEAMAEFPETFNQVFISLIHTGEESGTLSRVFQHLTETLKWHDEMIAKTKKLLTYPTFMGIILLGVMFFIMMFLVPQLITFFKSLNIELPLQTRILLFVSNLFVNYWYIILTTPVLIFLSLKAAIKVSPRLHLTIDHFKLRVWIIGPILEKIILARFATFFALLYSAGITVLDSLQISKGLVGNVVIEKALQDVSDHIADGVSITESFDRVNLFPPLVLRMVRVGESTGELDIALANVSYFYNREVRESIDKLQTLIEPVMVVVLGVLLGWVILSFFLPLYDVMIDITNEVGSQQHKIPRN